MTKSLPITYQMVVEAYLKVKDNRGSAGVDRVSLELFSENLQGNLYKIWNRLTSGSYFPPPVREVLIPKRDGKQRKLGIPTVGDRIAQQVIKTYLEPRLEKEFHKNSYGYRPLKSAHQAIRAVQFNVRHYSWVIDMDIKSFFDEVDHKLMMKALDRHVEEKWVKMYITRWLQSPVKTGEGDTIPKQGKGTPQGGVISPLLANLYLHYAFDKWFGKLYPHLRFVRYADDIVIHCTTETEAQQVLKSVKERMQSCTLRLHEQKTKIVHCVGYKRKRSDYPKRFDFLGFSFKPLRMRSNKGKVEFLGYGCEVSISSRKRINEEIKQLRFHKWTTGTIEEIAAMLNLKLAGWVNYYGKINRSGLNKVFRLFHNRLAKWVLNKYKVFRKSYGKVFRYLRTLRKGRPELFYHWKKGYQV